MSDKNQKKKTKDTDISRGTDEFETPARPVLARIGIGGLAASVAVMAILMTTTVPQAFTASLYPSAGAAPAPTATASPSGSKGEKEAPGESAEASKSAAPQKSTAKAAAKQTDSETAAAPAEEPTPAPSWVNVDFSNSVIIGSSTTEALYIHDLLEGANYLYGTGLTVETVMTEKMPGSEVAIIDELAGKSYNQVFLAFGLNELGWPDDAVFARMYGDVISRVREYLPTAAIYIESVLPVGIGTSKRNRFGVNQDRINAFNIMLQQVAADNNVHYIDVSTEMKGPDGYLPQDAAADGIHPNLEACRKWVSLIAQRVEETLNAGTGATPPAPSEEVAQSVPDPAAVQTAQAPPVPSQAASDPAEAPALEPAPLAPESTVPAAQDTEAPAAIEADPAQPPAAS